MPYRNPLGLVYDSGDYAAALDRAVALADWAGVEARRAEAAIRVLSCRCLDSSSCRFLAQHIERRQSARATARSSAAA